jgi:hypothetical protein
MNAPKEIQVLPQDLSTFAVLVRIYENPTLGFWLLFALVVILLVIVFNLGFARKLPILKNVIVYSMLLLGAFPNTFLAIAYPISESLVAIVLLLITYKFRLSAKSHTSD